MFCRNGVDGVMLPVVRDDLADWRRDETLGCLILEAR
jgi:hypothetical protein